MKVKLAYGKRGLELNIPEGYHTDIIEPGWVEGIQDPVAAVSGALKSPIRSKALKNLAGKEAKIGIIFSDITRATPYHIILPALLSELKHVKQENITFFCATGTHRPATEEELETILGGEITGSYKVVQNEARNKSMRFQIF